MALKQNYGYAGQILRVNLSRGESVPEPLEAAALKKYLGGAALGIKYIFDEVPPGVAWSDPENRLFIGSGPLTGTRIGGSGSIAVVTKGALTNGMASTQANGFFGAFLKFAGFDGIILEGAAPRWVYLYIHDGNIEIRDAAHLVGKNTLETESTIKEELHKKERETSVLCIGPAGENLVRFAAIHVDGGHMASHNGGGAVMGSKKLKAIVIDRHAGTPALKDKETVSRLAKEILARVSADMMGGMTLKNGTVGGVVNGTKNGTCPVKNYTTNIHAIDPGKLEAYSAENIRQKFNARRTPCWACLSDHSQQLEITEGKYRGLILDEPEFEGMSAFSSLVGVNDVTTTVVLASEVDRLGMDVNESGWVIAFVMECYEKRIISGKDTDGLEMTWGNGEAIMALLNKTAHRQGFGDVLAEGVMRAAQHIGGEAPKFAVHTQKGNTPRSHDHRVMRYEQFDTSVSNLGTLESHSGFPLKLIGLPPVYDAFDPEVLPAMVARIKGAMVFEDSLVTCRFQTGSNLDLLCQAVSSATGWDMDIQQAITIGKRAVNLARLFNLRHGIDAKLDAPSMRYGSTPLDGKAAGRGVMPQWDRMLQVYYEHMGWDKNGQPLPETLKSLDIEDAIIK